MKNKKYKKGFTLIELLVVVLIIGVLAGVALPQYKKSKEKTNAVELMTTVRALNNAQRQFKIANGRYADKIDELLLNFQGFNRSSNPLCDGALTNSDCINNGKVAIILATYGGKSSRALYISGKYNWSGFMIVEDAKNTLKTLPLNKLLCYEYGSNGFCSKLLNCDLLYTLDFNNKYYTCKN